jgi:hypothetical protein
MSDQPKVTDWFAEDVRPAMPGIYQTQDGSGIFFSYWDGEQFCFRSCKADDAYANRGYGSFYGPRAQWRGLVENPSKEESANGR